MTSRAPIVVAIDGTSASGKSTNAQLVAKALGYVYVDTGAMYRTLAWTAISPKRKSEPPRRARRSRTWPPSPRCANG
jgi:cytidylate kinase